MVMPSIDLPIRAASETAIAHGMVPDRCDILQNGSTLVLRLTDTLVARVVQDVSGPRQGTEWFARENAIALHLTQLGAPIIPLHPDLPPGPHEHLGYPMNFWRFVTVTPIPPDPSEIGRTLQQCHSLLQSFSDPLPTLAILTESLELLQTRPLFPQATLDRLIRLLTKSISILRSAHHQPLHGDAHLGNLMQTTEGLLWSDWEDTFSGPIEWDIASIIWNAKILESDHHFEEQVVASYVQAGGSIISDLLQQCLIARAIVMTSWYPILYPFPDQDRQTKLQRRLDWLDSQDT